MMKKNPQPLSELSDYVNQERLIFLAEGVFAIIMTLLVEKWIKQVGLRYRSL